MCIVLADCAEFGWVFLLPAGQGFAGDDVEPRLGQQLGAHVTPGDGPLVVLLGEHCAAQADERRAVRKDADDVGPTAKLLVEPLLGVVRPDLAPVLDREVGECKEVGDRVPVS